MTSTGPSPDHRPTSALTESGTSPIFISGRVNGVQTGPQCSLPTDAHPAHSTRCTVDRTGWRLAIARKPLTLTRLCRIRRLTIARSICLLMLLWLIRLTRLLRLLAIVCLPSRRVFGDRIHTCADSRGPRLGRFTSYIMRRIAGSPGWNSLQTAGRGMLLNDGWTSNRLGKSLASALGLLRVLMLGWVLSVLLLGWVLGVLLIWLLRVLCLGGMLGVVGILPHIRILRRSVGVL